MSALVWAEAAIAATPKLTAAASKAKTALILPPEAN
jgi:hypothetical protein